MVKAVAGDFGRIDILVNNSGILVRELFGQVPVEAWRRMLAVNIDGKRARLEVIASSAFNPFRLREIQQFRCPGAL